jgi:hypothetical protein
MINSRLTVGKPSFYAKLINNSSLTYYCRFIAEVTAHNYNN